MRTDPADYDMRVMLVDDNPDTLATMKLVLQLRGFEAETYLHARDALEAQRRRPVDVLITDIFMPDADGLEVIQQFRPRWRRTRIVAISGTATKVKGDYLETARQVGADRILRKPFDPRELLRLPLGLAAAAPFATSS
jgi:CheY-like chemotaxis protein